MTMGLREVIGETRLVNDRLRAQVKELKRENQTLRAALVLIAELGGESDALRKYAKDTLEKLYA